MRDAPRRPIKRLGQHFLSPAWAAKVVDAIAPQPGDVFLEIGSGTGALTRPLAARGVPIVAIEIDKRLASDLARDAPPNVTVWSGDILEMNVVPLLLGLRPQRPPGAPTVDGPGPRFRIAGNLPYYIASPILFRLVDLYREHRLFHDATVMVQREVADRLLARPRSKDYGVLTILLSLHSRITRLLDLPPGAFTPAPKVRSSVVRLEFGPPSVRIVNERMFEQVVKAMFSKRRKTLANALKACSPTAPAALAQAGVDPRRRAETLSLDEIARIVEAIAVAGRPPVL
ncbi:MAG: ribosomal RNA small subunit methyltransferase A [Acidobacteria bacterium]|nr:ribosomal RNA small subunit methyltransferase A [Acidobacteriota bacterium]